MYCISHFYFSSWFLCLFSFILDQSCKNFNSLNIVFRYITIGWFDSILNLFFMYSINIHYYSLCSTVFSFNILTFHDVSIKILKIFSLSSFLKSIYKAKFFLLSMILASSHKLNNVIYSPLFCSKYFKIILWYLASGVKKCDALFTNKWHYLEYHFTKSISSLTITLSEMHSTLFQKTSKFFRFVNNMDNFS